MNVDRSALEKWRAAAGLTANDVSLGPVEAAVRDLIASLGGLEEEFDADALYRYRVPMLSEDGSCSIIEELAPTPYDLSSVLGGRSDDSTRKLRLLNQAVQRVTDVTGAGWVGIYQRRKLPAGSEALVKLAYRGRPSRAEFPLTAEFAQGSTNSQVGLSGKAVVIPDVEAHVRSGGGFYVCDTAVQSEACLPIFAPGGMDVVGILDAEAEPKAFFTPERLAVLVAACLVAPSLFP
jgi:L-methionine (R)-S-oxide reductase